MTLWLIFCPAMELLRYLVVVVVVVIVIVVAVCYCCCIGVICCDVFIDYFITVI